MREVARFAYLGDQQAISNALQELADATLIDALTIADNFTVTNVTTTRTLDADTATLAQLCDFVGTFISDLKKRGANRVE